VTSPASPVQAGPGSPNQRLERLVEAGMLLISELSLEGVLQRTVRIAAEVINARYAAIGVLAPDGRVLESFTTHGITPEERARIGAPPRGHGILGLVIREARPIRLPDLTRHPDSYGFPPHHPEMHSFLGVPIRGRRGVLGNLYLTEKLGGGYFTDEDERLAVLLAALGRAQPVRVVSPEGAAAEAAVDEHGVWVRVDCGDPLDAVVLRSYCIGAAHMALGWVRSEGLAVDDAGVPQDLTIRSFGILRATEVPPVSVEIVSSDAEPVNGSDAVFAAVAAAAWVHEGCPQDWPTRRGATR